MFRCIVTNYGFGRVTFPTRLGNLYIGPLEPFLVKDQGVYEDLKRFEKSDKLGFKVAVDDENGQQPTRPGSGIHYVDFSINELRSIAAGKGVKGAFFMKKAELTQKLEEQNGTRPTIIP